MTPQEKAEELIDEFREYSQSKISNSGYLTSYENAIECALICVNEIIKSVPTQPSNSEMERIDAITFWILVKEELLRL